MSSDMTLRQCIIEALDEIKRLHLDFHPNDVPLDNLIETIEEYRDGNFDGDKWGDLDGEMREGVVYSIGYIVGVAEALDKTVRELFDQEDIS